MSMLQTGLGGATKGPCALLAAPAGGLPDGCLCVLESEASPCLIEWTLYSLILACRLLVPPAPTFIPNLKGTS